MSGTEEIVQRQAVGGSGRDWGSGESGAEAGSELEDPADVPSDSDHADDLEVQGPVRKRYRDKRYFKECPVEGCRTQKPLKKLSQHMRYAHSDIPEAERRRLVKSQPRIRKKQMSPKSRSAS